MLTLLRVDIASRARDEVVGHRRRAAAMRESPPPAAAQRGTHFSTGRKILASLAPFTNALAAYR